MFFYKNSRYNEEFAACILYCAHILDFNVIVGDEPNKSLPDIHTIDGKYGIEVVQVEQKIDYLMNRVLEHSKSCDFDAAKTIAFCNNKKDFQNKFEIMQDDGKIVSITSNERSHTFGAMRDIYTENLKKKLDKSEKRNYEGCEKVDLCCLMLQRRKTVNDVKLLAACYGFVSKDYERKFKKIFVLTTDSVFVVDANKLTLQDSPGETRCYFGDIKEIAYDYNKAVAYHKRMKVEGLNPVTKTKK